MHGFMSMPAVAVNQHIAVLKQVAVMLVAQLRVLVFPVDLTGLAVDDDEQVEISETHDDIAIWHRRTCVGMHPFMPAAQGANTVLLDIQI